MIGRSDGGQAKFEETSQETRQFFPRPCLIHANAVQSQILMDLTTLEKDRSHP